MTELGPHLIIVLLVGGGFWVLTGWIDRIERRLARVEMSLNAALGHKRGGGK